MVDLIDGCNFEREKCWWRCCWCFYIMFYNLFMISEQHWDFCHDVWPLLFYLLSTSWFLRDGYETCAAAGIVSLRLGPCFCVSDCVSPRAPCCRVWWQHCAAVGGCHAAGAGGAHRSHGQGYFSCVWRERKVLGVRWGARRDEQQHCRVWHVAEEILSALHCLSSTAAADFSLVVCQHFIYILIPSHAAFVLVLRFVSCFSYWRTWCVVGFIVFIVIIGVVLQKVSYDRAFHADCDAYNDFDMYPNILDHHDQLMIMTVILS